MDKIQCGAEAFVGFTYKNGKCIAKFYKGTAEHPVETIHFGEWDAIEIAVKAINYFDNMSDNNKKIIQREAIKALLDVPLRNAYDEAPDHK